MNLRGGQTNVRRAAPRGSCGSCFANRWAAPCARPPRKFHAAPVKAAGAPWIRNISRGRGTAETASRAMPRSRRAASTTLGMRSPQAIAAVGRRRKTEKLPCPCGNVIQRALKHAVMNHDPQFFIQQKLFRGRGMLARSRMAPVYSAPPGHSRTARSLSTRTADVLPSSALQSSGAKPLPREAKHKRRAALFAAMIAGSAPPDLLLAGVFDHNIPGLCGFRVTARAARGWE